jgi:adenosylmethionine-8-amino-7-oxononanoate aminotransferase
MAAQFWQLSGEPRRSRFVAFHGAYHGDTMGASALGGIPLFHDRFAAWQFPVQRVADFEALQKLSSQEIAAVVIEPLVQGANQMFVWPKGLLAKVRSWCDAHDVFLIADEVLTGFGRTGTLFACEQEGVVPDFVALAKGLTGGYMPLAATLTKQSIFHAFTGGPERTLYYGHSYCGNALGCAVALENLAVFREEKVLSRLQSTLIPAFHSALERHLAPLPEVYGIRKCGLMAGVEVRMPDGRPFDTALRMGSRICAEARAWNCLWLKSAGSCAMFPSF